MSYVDQVNRVFGPDSPVGRWHGDVVLANVAQTLPIGTLTFFDYYLDLDDAVAPSSNTLGARAHGLEEARQDRRHVRACRTRTRPTPARIPRISRTTTTCSRAG